MPHTAHICKYSQMTGLRIGFKVRVLAKNEVIIGGK